MQKHFLLLLNDFQAYDGVNARITLLPVPLRKGCQVHPILLESVNDYEMLNTHEVKEMDAHVGDEVIEDMNSEHIIYFVNIICTINRKIFLQDVILVWLVRYCIREVHSGTSVDLQAGLALPTADGYEFKAAQTIGQVDDFTYEGARVPRRWTSSWR